MKPKNPVEDIVNWLRTPETPDTPKHQALFKLYVMWVLSVSGRETSMSDRAFAAVNTKGDPLFFELNDYDLIVRVSIRRENCTTTLEVMRVDTGERLYFEERQQGTGIPDINMWWATYMEAFRKAHAAPQQGLN